MVVGAAALTHGGEVAGAGAGVGYNCSEVAGVGQDRRGEPDEHTGGVVATKLGLEMGERQRESSGLVGGNSGEESRPGRGGLGRAKAWTSYGRVRGTSRTKAGHRAGLIRPVTVRARRTAAAELRRSRIGQDKA
jgi:hypothetical protein